LLSDAEKTTATDYGVLKKLGTFTFAKRQSFIIDPAGNIARHYEKVAAESHSTEVLADLQSLMNPTG